MFFLLFRMTIVFLYDLLIVIIVHITSNVFLQVPL